MTETVCERFMKIDFFSRLIKGSTTKVFYSLFPHVSPDSKNILVNGKYGNGETLWKRTVSA